MNGFEPNRRSVPPAWARPELMTEEVFGTGTIWIGAPGHPIQHHRYGFDAYPPPAEPKYTMVRTNHDPWAAATYRTAYHHLENRWWSTFEYEPRGTETWVQVYPDRDWECILPGRPKGFDYRRMAMTRQGRLNRDWIRL